MSYDFYATKEEVQDDVEDIYARIQLLANSQPDKDAKERHQKLFQQQYNHYIQGKLSQINELVESDLASAIDMLPSGTATLQFTIRLARPFISRDDTDYHICDNPVQKERVFRIPMMPATGWKGALRAAAIRQLVSNADELDPATFSAKRYRLAQLFGSEKSLADTGTETFLDKIGGDDAAQIYRELLEKRTKTGFIAGRLRFYATFFDKVTVEVINPHDRIKKAGKWPVYFEAADIYAKGTFALLYVPFDLVNVPKQKAFNEIALDLQIMGTALHAMLTTYGFGAKTSSGFGVAKDQLPESGQLVIKIAGLPPEELEDTKPAIPQRKKTLRRYWKAENQLMDEFLTPEGKFVSDEEYESYIQSLGQEYTKSERQLFEKARKWWELEGKVFAQQQLGTEPEPESEVEQAWAECSYNTLGEMVVKIGRLANALQEEASDE